jgi:SAM-dependent methyltransferase
MVGGRAEDLPLAPDSVDLAWLSTTIHQFDDRRWVAAELRRVIRPGGRVLVRGFFADVPVTGLLAEFPGIDRAAATFPTTAAITDELTAAGFTADPPVDVVEPWTFKMADWPAKVWSIRDADSALRPLTDDEIRAGIAAVSRAHADADRLASPGTLRLLCFEKQAHAQRRGDLQPGRQIPDDRFGPADQ